MIKRSSQPKFNHPAVRDLAWILFSPSLLDVNQLGYQGFEFPQAEAWQFLLRVDKHPAKLEEHLKLNPQKRLGLYFESLLGFYLQEAEHIELLLHHRQVSRNKITIGEFDFVFFCHKQQKHIHLECACKFYLGIEDTLQTEAASEWSQWVGPMCRDRMDLKLDKLLAKQLLLAKEQEAKDILSSLGVAEVEPALCLKGMLFYPEEYSLVGPKHMKESHQRSAWVHHSKLKAMLTSHESRWCELGKLQWLSDQSDPNAEELLGTQELLDFIDETFIRQERPVMIGEFTLEHDVWKQQRKFFVVPEHWPFQDRLDALSSKKRASMS